MILEKGFSFILCTCNAAQRLAPCLESIIEAGMNSPVDWEVVLVDNASTDKTAEIARSIFNNKGLEQHLAVVPEERPGTCFARPAGLRACRYSYFSFVDDDNLVAPDWIVCAVESLSNAAENAVFVGVNEGKYETEPPSWFYEFESMIAIGRPQSFQQSDRFSTTWTAGMTAHTKAVLRAVDLGDLLTTGPQGDRLTRGEDKEICYRMHFENSTFQVAEELPLKHCIPSNRLEWAYLEKLAEGNGLGAPFLNLYVAVLSGKSWPGHPVAQLLFYLYRLGKLFCTSPKISLGSVKGSKKRIQWLSSLSALKAVFQEYSALSSARHTVLNMYRKAASGQ